MSAYNPFKFRIKFLSNWI